MLILGLDPGLTRCGVGLVRLDENRAAHFHSVTVLQSPVDADLPERLRSIGTELASILTEHRPDAVALERVFAQNNVSTVMGTAQVSGVVMYLAAQAGIPVTMYTPSEVKAQVTGYGAADKRQVTAMVTKLLKLQTAPKPADAADALALALTHAWRQGRSALSGDGTPISSKERPSTPAQLAWLAAQQRTRKQ
jgi:crossover junction endodeoxyribonuclease RuvC